MRFWCELRIVEERSCDAGGVVGEVGAVGRVDVVS